MSHDITALRAALFATLDAIRDGSIDLDKAKAINDTAQTIINTAKVEVEYMRHTGANVASNFVPIAAEPAKRPAEPTPPKKQLDYVGQPIRGAINGTAPQTRP